MSTGPVGTPGETNMDKSKTSISTPVPAPAEPLRILFMGTPDFAAVSLRALSEYTARCGGRLVGVFTREDKPSGRGYKLTPPPVKVLAQELGLPVFQPKTLRTEEAMETLRALDPNLIIVVAYGRILPPEVLDYPAYGCINVHGSLLPEYRGAAPMQRAMIDGKTVTGITTMYMNEGLDTGDMLLRREVPIGENDDFGVLHDRMAAAGADLLTATLDALCGGRLTRTTQTDEGASYAAKIEKSDCRLDFERPASELYDLIRGTSPAPLAWTHTPDGKLLKIAAARLLQAPTAEDVAPGTVTSLDGHGEGGITVACGKDSLIFTRVLPEGKGHMSAAEFIRGRKINEGDRLS